MMVLDRIEEGRLVLLDDDGHKTELLPDAVSGPYAEGDVMIPAPDGRWQADPDATARRREQNARLLEKVLRRGR